MSRRPIRFVHRGQIVELDGLPPTTSVLAWLREHRRLTGTKEGCNEGDCGACTVVVGELVGEPPVDDVRLRTANACLMFVPALDGKALWTVEDLGGRHPAQRALVDAHGSQCGFCTPGFVMSLAALHQRHTRAGTRPTRAEIADELSGNLCRCTGYRPILDAGVAMFEAAAPAIDTAPIAAALRMLRGDEALHIDGFWAPRRLDELAALRRDKPDARLLAGGTDVGVWVNKQFRELGELIDVGRVAELRRIDVVDGTLEIGAAASLTDGWDALVAHWPTLREMALRFASPPIRNAGTLVGNVANGSPIGDVAPVLIALGATIRLQRGDAERSMPLEAFYVDYMKNRLERGEFVRAVVVPLPVPRAALRAYKLAKRYDSDISAVAAGLWLALDGDVVHDARFAFGGMAGIVRRAAGAEAAVRGRRWSEATVRAAMDALDRDYQPLTDLRASAAHRRRAARHLLYRFWLETRHDAPLAAHETSVWAAGARR